MALNRVDFPTTPNPAVGDWAKQTTLVSRAYGNLNVPIQFYDNEIPPGAVIQIEGIIYYASGTTLITGTPSAYIKITPNVGDSGATADAAYISSLSGILWYATDNGYYDVSGNLVIFDETLALRDGAITEVMTKVGRLGEKTPGITISTSVPSGGIDGDLWFRIS